MAQTAPIVSITGPPGAGKASVAAAPMQRFPFDLHIPMDELREFTAWSGAGPEERSEQATSPRPAPPYP